MEHTSNYELSKWAESDRILMEDFNMDHDKIDAALAAGLRIATGTYDGTNDTSNPNVIDVGFHPIVVLLVNSRMSFENSAALLTRANPLVVNNQTLGEITETGFLVRHASVTPYLNTGTPYIYIAFA